MKKKKKKLMAAQTMISLFGLLVSVDGCWPLLTAVGWEWEVGMDWEGWWWWETDGEGAAAVVVVVGSGGGGGGKGMM
jgi:hypothetical protein